MGHTRTHCAVMYVRMSTESQDYSTDHQRAEILEYAAAHQITVIREYVDDGKSGLDIKRRAGLSALMLAVQSTEPDFDQIIVYDVSRWGRFQDMDEAAYHEHTCRRAGIEVVYCGEKFVGDTGPYASLMKSMKRIMAAEYSRELSDKVFAAQARFVKMGFKQGGHAGYGLRRLAIKACGTPRAILEYGESKVAVTDRVLLVRGPDSEIVVVQKIYDLYLKERASEAGIARQLNSRGITTEFGRPWTQAMVNSILTNHKYCGALVYNRRTSRLSMPRRRNSADAWIVNSGGAPAIVSADLFTAAQAERARRQRRYTPGELITLLCDCHRRHGKVNATIIAADEAMPDPQLFVRAFGSLVHAYDAAGLPRSLTYAFVETKAKLAAIRADLVSKVENQAAHAGATVRRTSHPSVLVLNGNLIIRIEVAVPRQPKRGQRSWKISAKNDAAFLIVGRWEPATCTIADYFLLSAADLAPAPIYIKVTNLDRYSTSRYPTVAAMFGTATANTAAP